MLPSTMTQWIGGALCALGLMFAPAPEPVAAVQDPARAPTQAPQDRDNQDSEAAIALRNLAEATPRTRQFIQSLAQSAPDLHRRLVAHAQSRFSVSEASAMEFVRAQHPELARVIDRLRTMRNQRPFRAALRELRRDIARIAVLRARSPAAYEAAVQDWKLRSRIRLAAAHAAAGTDNRDDLTALVRESMQRRRASLEDRAARLREQLRRIEERLAEDPAAAESRELEALEQRIERRRKQR